MTRLLALAAAIVALALWRLRRDALAFAEMDDVDWIAEYRDTWSTPTPVPFRMLTRAERNN